MQTALTVAVAQTVPRPGDVAANVREHVSAARRAAERHARVVVFPELSLTGYELDRAAALAFGPEDPRLAPLREAAGTGALTLVVGAPIRLETGLHLGAFVLDPEGGVRIYTKRRLGAFGESARRDGSIPPAEATVFRPGTHDPPVRLGDRTAAVAICADTGDGDHARAAAARGASIYLASMFVIPSEFEAEAAALQQRARDHSLTVAMANYGGPSGGLAAAGRSTIWSATGEVLGRLEAAGSGLLVATVP